MGFTFVSPLSTQTGSRQSQVVTATNAAVTTSTGTITAAANWSTVRVGQAFAVLRAGAVIAVRCIASASGTELTYFRLYLENGTELATTILAGDTIEICEQADLVGAGNVLNGNGATLTTTGNYLSYATGTNQIRVDGFFQLPTSQFLLTSPAVATGQATAALHSWTNGLLVMGEYLTNEGVSTFASEGLMRHTGAPGSIDASYGIGINACRGIHWFGGTFSGDRAIGVGLSQVNAPMVIYSKSVVLKSVNLPSGGAYQFRTPNNLTVYGLTLEGRTLGIIGSNPNIQGLVVRRTTLPVSLGGASPANQFIPLVGTALKAGNLWAELGMWTNKWYRVINHATGSDCRVGGNLFNSLNASNRGLAEFRQEIRGTLLTKARTPIAGAKVFIRDTNNGNRLAASQFGTNPSYIDDRTYYITSNSSGVFEFLTDGGVLVAVKYQNLANIAVQGYEGVVEDYRGPGNSNDDLFEYHTVAYGYLPLSLSAKLQGTVPKDLSTTLDVDTAITQASLPTVLAYTTIDTQAKFYDRAQAWLTESSANQELPGLGNQLVTLENAALQLGARNFVIDTAAATAFAATASTITIKATALTAAVVTTGTATLPFTQTDMDVQASSITVTGVNTATLTASTEIIGLPTSGPISTAGALGFGTGSTIAATGDLSISDTALAGTLTINTATAKTLTLTNCTGPSNINVTGGGSLAITLINTSASVVTAGTGVTVTVAATINNLDPSTLGTTWVLGWITDANYQASIQTNPPNSWTGWNELAGTGNSTTLSLLPNTLYQLFIRIPGYYNPVGPLTTIDTSSQFLVSMNPAPDLDLTNSLIWPQTAAYASQAANFSYNSTDTVTEYNNTTGSTVYVDFLAAYRALELITKNASQAYSFAQPLFLNPTRNGFFLPRTNPLTARMSTASNGAGILLADISYSDNQQAAFDRFEANPAHMFLLVPQATQTISTSTITSIQSGLALQSTLITMASQASVDQIPTNTLLTNDARLNNLDVTVSSRLAESAYVAPTAAPTSAQNAAAVRTELAPELGRIDVAVSTRSTLTAGDIPAGLTAAQVWSNTTRTLTETAGLTPEQEAALNAIPTLQEIEASTVLAKDATVLTRLAANSYQVAPTPAAIRSEIERTGGMLDALPILLEIEASNVLAKQSGFVGLATSTNVSDAQVAIVSEINANETKINGILGDTAAIKAKTDTLINTDLSEVAKSTEIADLKTSTLKANVVQVTGITIGGNGTEETPWGPSV